MDCTQTKDSQQRTMLFFKDLKGGQWFSWKDVPSPSPCIKIKEDLYLNVCTGHSGSISARSCTRVLLVDGSIFWHVAK